MRIQHLSSQHLEASTDTNNFTPEACPLDNLSPESGCIKIGKISRHIFGARQDYTVRPAKPIQPADNTHMDIRLNQQGFKISKIGNMG